MLDKLDTFFDVGKARVYICTYCECQVTVLISDARWVLTLMWSFCSPQLLATWTHAHRDRANTLPLGHSGTYVAHLEPVLCCNSTVSTYLFFYFSYFKCLQNFSVLMGINKLLLVSEYCLYLYQRSLKSEEIAHYKALSWVQLKHCCAHPFNRWGSG